VDEQISKMWSMYAMEYLFSLKAKEILTYAKIWMNLQDIILSEISLSQKTMYDSTYMSYLEQ
jgi:hypothetical protein